MEDEDDTGYEAAASFQASECICEHEPDEHGWCGCTVEGCECDAHWEE